MRFSAALLVVVVACGGGGDDDAARVVDAAGVDNSDAAVAAPECGNGELETGELCDPCPATCDDGLNCTADSSTGSAAMCDLVCAHDSTTDCINGDGCCAKGCTELDDDDCFAFTIDPEFAGSYEIRDLGAATGLPSNYGGLVIDPDAPNALLIGGAANTAPGALYQIDLTRDELGHISGIAGEAAQVALAAFNDGGVVFGPDNVLFLARYPSNELGMMFPDNTDTDKVVGLTELGVVASPGGLAFVPDTHPGAGGLKMVSWPGGQWYDVTITSDFAGLFNVTAATLVSTIVGGPEGIVYVPIGSPVFDEPSMLISEYSAGAVAAYEVDANGDPVIESRRDFMTGLVGAEGAAIDPVSGDFLFSTFGGGDRIIVVRGFASGPSAAP